MFLACTKEIFPFNWMLTVPIRRIIKNVLLEEGVVDEHSKHWHEMGIKAIPSNFLFSRTIIVYPDEREWDQDGYR